MCSVRPRLLQPIFQAQPLPPAHRGASPQTRLHLPPPRGVLHPSGIAHHARPLPAMLGLGTCPFLIDLLPWDTPLWSPPRATADHLLSLSPWLMSGGTYQAHPQAPSCLLTFSPLPPGGPAGASASKPSPGGPCLANLRSQLTAQLPTPISPWILVCQEAGLKPNTAPHHLAQQLLLARVPPHPGLPQTSQELA